MKKIIITIASLTSIWSSAVAETFQMEFSGSVWSVSTDNVPTFPIVDTDTFSMSLDFDMDKWEWKDLGGDTHWLLPVINNNTNDGFDFSISIGSETWELNGAELDNFDPFRIQNYRSTSFAADKDKIEFELSSSQAPAGSFPFFIKNTSLNFYMDDRVEHDFILNYGIASNSNVSVSDVNSQVITFSNESDSGTEGWYVDLRVDAMNFSTVPESSQTALFGSIVALFAILNRRRFNQSR